MLPKFPWPSTRGTRIEKSWAMRTIASYTATSPWGWYLPNTSPTSLALFLYEEFGLMPSPCIA